MMLTEKDKGCLDGNIYGTWTENSETGLIDVEGNVYLANLNLTKIPFKFGTVNGNFWCHDNQLTTLENSPVEVNGDFICIFNQLTSLKYCPKYIRGIFHCFNNPLDPTSDESIEYFKKIGIEKINSLNKIFIDYLINLGFEENNSSFKTIMESLYKKLE